MTENDLEKQAKLWHVESTLEPHKTAPLEARLKGALPTARTRYRARVAAGVALTLLPVGGVTIAALGLSPLTGKAQIERLEFSVSALASDGTVVGTVIDGKIVSKGGMAVQQEERVSQKPGQSLAEPITIPSVVREVAEKGMLPGTICELLPNGAFLVNGYLPDKLVPGGFSDQGQIWQGHKVTALLPLPGFQRSRAIKATALGIIGESIGKPIPATLQTKKTNLQVFSTYSQYAVPTLWRSGKPEPFLPMKSISSSSVSGVSSQGDALLSMGKEDNVLKTHATSVAVFHYKDKSLTYLKPMEGDFSELHIAEMSPLKVGKDGAVVGNAATARGVRGVIWPARSERPRLLWEPRTWLDYEVISCNDIDETGRIVGTMTNEALESTTAFLWKDGRCVDLQKLLPLRSGWKLMTATQLRGRYVLGEGEYQGKHASFRLTLPKELE